MITNLERWEIVVLGLTPYYTVFNCRVHRFAANEVSCVSCGFRDPAGFTYIDLNLRIKNVWNIIRGRFLKLNGGRARMVIGIAASTIVIFQAPTCLKCREDSMDDEWPEGITF